jgi:hypothetical protein
MRALGNTPLDLQYFHRRVATEDGSQDSRVSPRLPVEKRAYSCVRIEFLAVWAGCVMLRAALTLQGTTSADTERRCHMRQHCIAHRAETCEYDTFLKHAFSLKLCNFFRGSFLSTLLLGLTKTSFSSTHEVHRPSTAQWCRS